MLLLASLIADLSKPSLSMYVKSYYEFSHTTYLDVVLEAELVQVAFELAAQ